MPNKYALDLDLAWRATLGHVRRDAVPDVLGWLDYNLIWNTWRDSLEAALDADIYSPQPARVFDVPKDGYVTRPMAILTPSDRVLYEAIADLIAPSIDPVLPDCVYSSRMIRRDGVPVRRAASRRGAWLRFQRAALELHYSRPYAFMLSTDVTSYFEYVELTLLLEDLRDPHLGISADTLGLLDRFLKSIQASSDIWGLPQGPEASRLLGNFYLLPVDSALAQRGLEHVRYQDDVKIFSGDSSSLKTGLQEVIRVLRHRHLNVSPSKTRLFEGPEIAADLEDLEKDGVEYVMGSAKARGIPLTDPQRSLLRRQLRTMFDGAVADRPVDARSVRFSIYRMAELEDDYAVNWLLEHLPEVPYLGDNLVAYLQTFIAAQPPIEDAIRSYLSDETLNIYAFAELHLVRLLATKPILRPGTKTLIWRILRDQNKDTLVRQHAARCVGRHADPGDAQLLKGELSSCGEDTMRRALLVGIREACGADSAWFSATAEVYPSLRHTCHYLGQTLVLSRP
jgi:hypothetical protein